MNTLNTPSIAQLKRAVVIKERIAKLELELSGLLGSISTPAPSPAPKAKRKMSAKGLANLRAAQKKRWAKINAAKAKKK